MLDNLWFWEKWLIDEYEKEACNLLAMNVVRFTPVTKNLHGHNFQSSWRIVTQIGNLLPINLNFRMRDRNWQNLKKNPHASRGVVRSWWKSLLCSRPKSLTFLFGLCPSSLLRKSSTLCCILFDVVRTMSTLPCSPQYSTSTRSVWHLDNKAYALCFVNKIFSVLFIWC